MNIFRVMLNNSCGVTTDIFKIKKANLVPITLKKISTTKAYNSYQQIYRKTTYKMITSQYVASQAQTKNFLMLKKVMFRS